MICTAMPPVGTRVSPVAGGALPLFRGFSSLYYASGTAALAKALLFARSLRPEVKDPVVLLPAYGCPDLIAAAVYAGVRPNLVDIEGLSPSYDLSRLRAAFQENDVVALVAVNFLGIRENIVELAQLAAQHGAALIEDSAQCFPERLLNGEENPADMIVLSFGRGKPVNLLGGGGLLVARRHERVFPGLVEDAESGAEPDRHSSVGIKYRCKARVFNTLLNPFWFWCVSKLPFLNIGATRYHPLMEIGPIKEDAVSCLPRNVEEYCATDRWREGYWEELLSRQAGILDLSAHHRARVIRLLRYPILIKEGLDESLRNRMLKQNLGVSALYQTSLPEFEGVDKILNVGKGEENMDYPGAKYFASRLLTLPLHSGVTRKHMNKVVHMLATVPG